MSREYFSGCSDKLLIISRYRITLLNILILFWSLL